MGQARLCPSGPSLCLPLTGHPFPARLEGLSPPSPPLPPGYLLPRCGGGRDCPGPAPAVVKHDPEVCCGFGSAFWHLVSLPVAPFSEDLQTAPPSLSLAPSLSVKLEAEKARWASYPASPWGGSRSTQASVRAGTGEPAGRRAVAVTPLIRRHFARLPPKGLCLPPRPRAPRRAFCGVGQGGPGQELGLEVPLGPGPLICPSPGIQSFEAPSPEAGWLV